MNNYILGKYENKNTIFHRLDGRLKLFFSVIFMILLFLPFNMYSFIILFSTLLIFFIISKINFLHFFKTIKSIWFMFIVVLLINIFTIKTGKIIFQYDNFYLFLDSITTTIYVFSRIIMIFMISILLTQTTKPDEITKGIKFYLTPLKYLKVNINEIALMISIAFRFIPILFEESNKIMKSQINRGVNKNTKNIKNKIIIISSLIIPLLMSTFNKADELAIAMYTRGYENDNKTSYISNKLYLKDYLFLVVFILIIIAFILSRVLI